MGRQRRGGKWEGGVAAAGNGDDALLDLQR